MKRILSGLFCIMLLSLTAVAAPTVDMTVSFVASEQFSTEQGSGSWFYQMKRAGVYEALAYNASTNRWTADNTGGAYIGASVIHPGNQINTARVWEAAMPGVVRLEPNGNVRKNGMGGVGVTVRILKNDEVIWTQFIEGTDGVGYSYSLQAEVKRGDRLYFEVSADSVAYGETAWNPTVTYIQAGVYSINGTAVNMISELRPGDTVTCTFYDRLSVEESAVAYLAVYDDAGRLRKVSEPNRFVFASKDAPYADTALLLDVPANSYAGWNIALIVLTARDGRYFPEAVSDVIELT